MTLRRVTHAIGSDNGPIRIRPSFLGATPAGVEGSRASGVAPSRQMFEPVYDVMWVQVVRIMEAGPSSPSPCVAPPRLSAPTSAPDLTVSAWDDDERAALVALLRVQPGGGSWPDLVADVADAGSARDVWARAVPANLFEARTPGHGR